MGMPIDNLRLDHYILEVAGFGRDESLRVWGGIVGGMVAGGVVDPLRLIHPTTCSPRCDGDTALPTARADTVGWNKRSGSTRHAHREDFGDGRFRALRSACRVEWSPEERWIRCA